MQVLNHLEDKWNGIDFPVLEKTLVHTKRVLRKNGVLLIIAATPSIMGESIWFSQIHPDITDKACKVYPSAKRSMNLFTKHGYQCVSAMNLIPTPASFYNEHCLHPEAPLDKGWRDGICVLQIAGSKTENELIQMVLNMKQKGTLNQYVTDHDRSSEIGVMTLFVCTSL